MNTSYKPIFTTRYYHDFYLTEENRYSELDSDFDCIPTPETLSTLQNLGLLFKKVPGGFTVLAAHYLEDGQWLPYVDLSPLATVFTLQFQLTAKNPAFHFYSELPTDNQGSSIYFFSNRANNKQLVNNEQELLLSANTTEPYLDNLDRINLRTPVFYLPFKLSSDTATISIFNDLSDLVWEQAFYKVDVNDEASERTFNPLIDITSLSSGRYVLKINQTVTETFYLDAKSNGHEMKKAFAIIEIVNDEHLSSDYQFATQDGLIAPKEYVLRVKNRETTWRYFIGLKYKTNTKAEDLSIISSQVAANFARQPETQMDNNLKVIPFESTGTQLPLKKAPIKGIKLQRKMSAAMPDSGQVEEIALPTPDITNMKYDQGTLYSEVFVYL